MKSCKRFSNIVNEHNKFWIRECLRPYLSYDLEEYCDLYDNEDYKSYIKNKLNQFQKRPWKKLLEEGIKLKIVFSTILKQIVPAEDAEVFNNYFYETLKRPNVPIPKLKRETIICTTQTLFQTKLSEVLYEDTGMLSNGLSLSLSDPYKMIIDSLKDHEKRFIDELMDYDKNELMKARWYLYESGDNESEDTMSIGDRNDLIFDLSGLKKFSESYTPNEETHIIQYNRPYLLCFYDTLHKVLTHFCRLVSEYLSSLDNIYDVLSEYIARWKTYVCSMLECEKMFQTFTELLNNHYEKLFEGYPAFPKFSMWRFMTKIWMREVFEKADLGICLNESFLRILNNHREKNVKESMNNNFDGLNLEMKLEMPKTLYINFNFLKKKNSSIKYPNYKQLVNLPHTCFASNVHNEKRLLSGFLQSILDISINEVNVHYLDCSDISTNYPYQELEDCFLFRSSEFYDEYQQLFQESPNYFCHFLKSDFSLLSEILTERTNLKLETIQVQNGMDFMRAFIYKQAVQLTEEQVQIIQNQPTDFTDQRDELDEFIEATVMETLSQVSKCKANFYSLPPIEDDEIETEEESASEVSYNKFFEDKGNIIKFIKYLDSKYPNLRGNFEYLKQRLEHFQNIKQKDEAIKNYNIEKNIPCEMGDVDSLFYDLHKNVDIRLLHKMHDDYQVYLKQQAREMNHQIGELPGLDEEKDNEPETEITMDKPGSKTLDNFLENPDDNVIDEEIDFLNTASLGLRTAHS